MIDVRCHHLVAIVVMCMSHDQGSCRLYIYSSFIGTPVMFTPPLPRIWDIHFLFSICLVYSVSFSFFRDDHLEVVQYLVDGGHCQPNSKDKDGETALHWAVK